MIPWWFIGAAVLVVGAFVTGFLLGNDLLPWRSRRGIDVYLTPDPDDWFDGRGRTGQ